MAAWWNSLGLISQIFYCIAVPSTLVMLIQTIMLLVGLGQDSDFSADGDVSDIADADVGDVPDADSIDGVFGDNDVTETPDSFGLEGLRILTLRGIISFLVVFGWVGIVLTSAKVPLLITVPVAAICGFFMMVLLAFLMKLVLKLRSDGNIDIRNAIGTAGKVYLTIPARRSGEGKVQLMLQGAFVEQNAVTDDEEPIPTGSEIVVIGVSGATTLVVRKK